MIRHCQGTRPTLHCPCVCQQCRRDSDTFKVTQPGPGYLVTVTVVQSTLLQACSAGKENTCAASNWPEHTQSWLRGTEENLPFHFHSLPLF
eukprot:882662-Rhodomonas_salina.1